MNKVITCFEMGILSAALAAHLMAADVYVDNVRGTENGSGTKEAPFKTIGKALQILKGGDTLHLTPNENVPYEEVIDTHPDAKWGGTAGNPTVIDGHGATITGLRHFPAAAWKDEGDGIFSRPLGNNAWAMDQQGYWSGHPIVFVDGKPAEFCKDKVSLREFTYFLHKDHPQNRTGLHNTLYIKLPGGKTPDEIKVVTVGTRTNIHINRSHITIKNLTSIYAGDDAFGANPSKGLVFENVRGAYCMDQGISHHGAESLVKNSSFDHNTICGIFDVYPESKVRYFNCVVESNGGGGATFHGGEYSMENCVIRNNQGAGVVVSRNALASLKNCYVESEEQKFRGVHLNERGLTMENCTIYNASEALACYLEKAPEMFDVINCAFINNRQNLKLAKAQSVEAASIRFKQNIYTPGDFQVFGANFASQDWGGYQKATGLDGDSQMRKYEGALPPLQTDLKKGFSK